MGRLTAVERDLLRDLVITDRFIEEASAMGFSIDDLLDQLQSRRKKELQNV